MYNKIIIIIVIVVIVVVVVVVVVVVALVVVVIQLESNLPEYPCKIAPQKMIVAP